MKLIFIYDNTELKQAGKITASDTAVKEIHVLTVENDKKRNLYDVAANIKKEASESEPCIIFIDQYLACADEDFEWLQHSAGIALIKFLRMMDMKHHIVLISPFEPLELVKLNPTNFIVASKGISLFKYLHEIKEKPIEYLKTLANNTFNEQDLKPYMLAEFRLPEDERHNWANWWGIDRLWNVHRVVEQKKYGLTERWNLKEYPEGLKSKLKALRNREALFLYGHREKFIVNNLAELNEEANKLSEILQRYISARNLFVENQNSIETKKSEKNSQIESLEQQISLINKFLPRLNGRLELFLEKRAVKIRMLISLLNEISELEQELTEEKQRTRQIGYAISDRENKLTELNNALSKEEEKYLSELKSGIAGLDNEIQKLQSKIISLSIPALREKLQKKSLKILYIDDQANEGWSNIFQHIIYNQEKQELFKVIQPKETDKINAQYFIDIISPEIISHNLDLILLDLRLNKESGIRIEVENLSGAILLKEIRKQFPGIPMLMTTASNKSWSYEELQRIGCDGFWTKEGIDTGMTEKDSVKNYVRFAELVNILTGEDYMFLAKYASAISKLKMKESHWWLNPKWCNYATDHYKATIQIKKEVVFDILDDTLLIFRNYLRKELVQSDFGNALNQWMYPSLIIQHLAKIVEHIHGVTQTGIPTTEYIKNTRGDKDAGELIKERGFSSHYNDAKTINNNSATGFVENLLKYLNDKPEFYVGPKIIGKISL